MTPGERIAAVTVVGLAIVCLGLRSNLIRAASRPAAEGHPHFQLSSVDLSSGTRDAIFSARGMVPGDTVTATLTVANSGRQPVTYGMTRGPVSAGGAALSAALVLTIKTVGSSCEDDNGTTLFEGPLDQAAFGGEGKGRSLPAATAEILCLRAVLPLAAGNDLQGAAATVTLWFGSKWPGAA